MTNVQELLKAFLQGQEAGLEMALNHIENENITRKEVIKNIKEQLEIIRRSMHEE